MREAVEEFLENLCGRMGVIYGGYHTLGAGRLDKEGCPEVAFHVGAPQQARLQPATGEVFSGTGVVYHALVGSTRTVVRTEGGDFVGEFRDLTKKDLFG